MIDEKNLKDQLLSVRIVRCLSKLRDSVVGGVGGIAGNERATKILLTSEL